MLVRLSIFWGIWCSENFCLAEGWAEIAFVRPDRIKTTTGAECFLSHHFGTFALYGCSGLFFFLAGIIIL